MDVLRSPNFYRQFLFQSLGAAEQKALSPRDINFVFGTIKTTDLSDLKQFKNYVSLVCNLNISNKKHINISYS